MIYISGDGCFSTKPQPEDPRFVLSEIIYKMENSVTLQFSYELHIIFIKRLIFFYLSYDHGGVLLSTKKEIEQLTPPLLNSKRQPHGKEPNW